MAESQTSTFLKLPAVSDVGKRMFQNKWIVNLIYSALTDIFLIWLKYFTHKFETRKSVCNNYLIL